MVLQSRQINGISEIIKIVFPGRSGFSSTVAVGRIIQIINGIF
jgi:hypothetical protein